MMCRHFVSCLEKGKMTPFPNTAKRVPFHLAMQKTKVPIFCICRLPYSVANVMLGIIPAVSKYLSGQSTPKESGGPKNAKMI